MVRSLQAARASTPRLTTANYGHFCNAQREIARLRRINEHLGMDSRQGLPSGGAVELGEQQKLLGTMIHNRVIAPALEQWARDASAENIDVGDPIAARNLELFLRERNRQSQLPEALVGEIATAIAASRAAWVEAKKASRFSTVVEPLTRLLALRREESAAIDATRDAYDVQLEVMLPGMTSRELAGHFSILRDGLVPLMGRVGDLQRGFDTAFMNLPVPFADQDRFFRPVARAMGFDFTRGRITTGEHLHPCCSEGNRHDTWIQLKYLVTNFFKGLRLTMHETGHGLYEQGLPAEEEGLPVGAYASVGLHESQSFFWERWVGLHPAFFGWIYPMVRHSFDAAFGDRSLKDVYRALHGVTPSLIRVEADELTYPLHIVLRTELEMALMRGELAVADLNAAFNEKVKTYLGIEVPSDDKGALQDVQWFRGAFGYFPAYALGGIYAQHFFEKASYDNPDIAAQFTRGEFLPTLDWLRTNVHQQGHFIEVPDLVRHVTGNDLNIAGFLAALSARYEAAHAT